MSVRFDADVRARVGASPRPPAERVRHSSAFDEDELDAFDDLGDRSQVDLLLDELVPPDLDWRRVVRRYPIPSLVVAGAIGYWLGRSKRGSAVVEALAGAVAMGVSQQVTQQIAGGLEIGDDESSELLDR